MKRSTLILGAAVGLGAFMLLSRKASAAVAGGEAIEADNDRLADSIPGAPAAPSMGAGRTTRNTSVLQPIVTATGNIAGGVVGVLEAGAKQLGAFFGQPIRSPSVGVSS